jgi:3-hydroxyacyl-CoA dehydrogenase/enoyl-CoA hydratase/3-hydroxybutyryl-CoA epimerase
MARNGISVRVVDLSLEALAKATAAFAKDLSARRRRKRMTATEARACLDRWTASTELAGVAAADLVLEAAAESVTVKQAIFSRLASRLREGTVLATNTSSLSLAALSKSLLEPARLVGIHFFNPPAKMPLIEVVRGPDTSPQAIATALRLAADLGKFPVVVKDGPGFLVNRCLAPYLAEAGHLLLEGVEPEALDRILLGFGFPMGPARLLDEVGWDIAAHAGESLEAAFGDRMAGPPLAKAMAAAKVLGNKSGGGLYREGKPFGPGRAVLAKLRSDRGRPPSAHSRDDVLDRCVLPLVAEAVRCADEGVAEGEDQIDMAMVLGIGFPPFRGGPFEYARETT